MPPIRRTRKLLYAIATTILFFGVLEWTAAWLGQVTIADREDPFVGFDSASLFVRDPQRAVWRTRESKRDWFNVQTFAQRKPATGLRIFCLGGSTTYGRPFDDSLSYCGQLRCLLKASGMQNVEVINAGGVSYASYRLASILREVMELQPDVIILYTGHNEFLEQRTYAPLEDMPSWQRESVSWLGRTHTYSMLHDLLKPSPAPAKMQSEVAAVLDGASGPEAYRRDDALRTQVVAHFRWNLRRMAECASEAGALFVLVTPASNIQGMSPFKSETQRMAVSEAEAITADARQALALGDPQAAAHTLEQLVKREPRYANAWHLAGRAALMTNRFRDAEAFFHRAVEEDVCALRAISPLVSAVHDIAEEKRLPLLDWKRWVREDCLRRHGHGCPGNDYFVDHVHPTVEMHGHLAIELAKLLQPHLNGAISLDERDAAQQLSLYRDKNLTPRKRGVAYRNLAKVLNWAGKHQEAGALALQAAELISDAESHVMAAAHLREFRRLDEAIGHARRAADLRPDWAEAQRIYGQLLAEHERWPEAIQALQTWARLAPQSGEAQAMLGAACAEAEQWGAAADHLLRAEALDGQIADQAARTAIALHRAGRTGEARERYESLLESVPTRTDLRFNLALLLLELNDPLAARQQLRRAAADGDRGAEQLLERLKNSGSP